MKCYVTHARFQGIPGAEGGGVGEGGAVIPMLLGSFVGGAPFGSQILNLFQTKLRYFPYHFSDLVWNRRPGTRTVIDRADSVEDP